MLPLLSLCALPLNIFVLSLLQHFLQFTDHLLVFFKIFHPWLTPHLSLFEPFFFFYLTLKISIENLHHTNGISSSHSTCIDWKMFVTLLFMKHRQIEAKFHSNAINMEINIYFERGFSNWAIHAEIPVFMSLFGTWCDNKGWSLIILSPCIYQLSSKLPLTSNEELIGRLNAISRHHDTIWQMLRNR